MEVSGFVLAGGKSARMGRDKALLEWRGRTLLDHVMALVRTAAHPVQVVGRDPLPDRLPGLGPLSGIATGLEASFTDANLFIAVDLPCLTANFLDHLRLRVTTAREPLIACKIGSDFPLCLGVWRPLLPEIHRRLRRRELSVRALIEAGSVEIITDEEVAALGFDLSMFRNINTQQEYRAALESESGV